MRPLTRNNELRVVPSWPRGEGNAAPLAAIFLAATASFWDGHHQGKTNVKTPRFREQDIPIAITTLIQVLVLQLIDSEVLTVEQAEQVFDGAAKRSARLKDVAPDAERVIQHLHDELNWDKYYKLAADRRRYRQERN